MEIEKWRSLLDFPKFNIKLAHCVKLRYVIFLRKKRNRAILLFLPFTSVRVKVRIFIFSGEKCKRAKKWERIFPFFWFVVTFPFFPTGQQDSCYQYCMRLFLVSIPSSMVRWMDIQISRELINFICFFPLFIKKESKNYTRWYSIIP